MYLLSFQLKCSAIIDSIHYLGWSFDKKVAQLPVQVDQWNFVFNQIDQYSVESTQEAYNISCTPNRLLFDGWWERAIFIHELWKDRSNERVSEANKWV